MPSTLTAPNHSREPPSPTFRSGPQGRKFARACARPAASPGNSAAHSSLPRALPLPPPPSATNPPAPRELCRQPRCRILEACGRAQSPGPKLPRRPRPPIRRSHGGCTGPIHDPLDAAATKQGPRPRPCALQFPWPPPVAIAGPIGGNMPNPSFPNRTVSEASLQTPRALADPPTANANRPEAHQRSRPASRCPRHPRAPAASPPRGQRCQVPSPCPRAQPFPASLRSQPFTTGHVATSSLAFEPGPPTLASRTSPARTTTESNQSGMVW